MSVLPQSQTRRHRILTISKPYVALAYRRKLALLQEAHPFDVGLVTPTSWAGQRFEPAETPESYWLKTLPIALDGRNHFHFYKGLEAAAREFRPDLINIEEEHYSVVTWQAFRLARRLGIPAVFYTWQNIKKAYPPPFSLIERRVFREAGAAICGNDEAVQVLRAKGFSGRAFEIPQMGVELARFTPAPGERAAARHALGMRDGQFWVAFVGRLVEEKGVQDLLAALTSTRPSVHALIVGGGPFAAELSRRAGELGLGARVVFKSAVPSTEVPAVLKAADALCLPSLTRANWKEQFGRVLVEAMVAGAVPIGSSSGEIPRVIGDAGLVFPEGRPTELAAALDRLATDPHLADTLRRRGAARAEARFSAEAVAREFAAAFLEVLRIHPGKPR